MANLHEIRNQLDQAFRKGEILTYGISENRALVISLRSPLGEAPAPVPLEPLLKQLREHFGDRLEVREIDQPYRFLATTISMGAGIVRSQPGDPGGPEGTLGLPLRDDTNGLYFLAAGHVLSNFWNSTSKDDLIDRFVAPGQQDHLGKVRDYVSVTPGSSANLDCGLITANQEFVSSNATACGFTVSANATVVRGQKIRKCGFRPPFECTSNVIWPSVSAPIVHNGQQYIFDNQILVSSDPEHPFAQLGDSGAVIVTDDDLNFVGMLIAGSVADDVFVVTPANSLEAYWKKFNLARLT